MGTCSIFTLKWCAVVFTFVHTWFPRQIKYRNSTRAHYFHVKICGRTQTVSSFCVLTSPATWWRFIKLQSGSVTGLLLYTGCPRRKGQNFGRMFLMLKYTDVTQNTYIQSWTVTEIMARERCGLLAGLRTVPCQLTAFRMSVLDCRVRLQKYRWRCSSKLPPCW